MKTNVKRVINILLTLAMIFSLITAFSGVAKAAPALSNGDFIAVGDVIKIDWKAAGISAGQQASIRVFPKGAPATLAYINQVTLEAENEFDIPLFVEAPVKGVLLDVVIAAATGDGTITIPAVIGTEKGDLQALYNASPVKEALYEAASWAQYVDVKADVQTCLASKLAIQTDVNELYADFVAAIKLLMYKCTAIKIDAPAAMTVPRNSTYTIPAFGIGAIKEEGSGIADYEIPVFEDFTWSINPTGYVTVETNADGYAVIKAGAKTGTAVLIVTDKLTGVASNIVLRII